MGNKIEEILNSRKVAQPPSEDEGREDKFFSILLGEGLVENFLELQARDGTRTCFPYRELSWFYFDPENGIDLDFNGYQVTIKGRGLAPKLWNGIKQMRVAWVKEADVELQDHKGNECFIEGILITPPDGPEGDDEEEE